MEIVIFDVETTGTSVVKDRIVSIAIKTIRGERSSEYHTLVNPGIPIPKDATEVHGITDEDVKDAPTFADIADEVLNMFSGLEAVAGFNSNNFDIPLLAEEFSRCGKNFMAEKRRYIDAYKIFAKTQKRDLTAALRFYCDTDLEGAHDALIDVRATEKVLNAQFALHPELLDIETCHEFCEWGDRADTTGHLIWVNGTLTYNFGKHKGKSVLSERGYARWMIENDFSLTTKALLRQTIG